MWNSLKSVLVPINKEGHPFILISGAVTLLLFLFFPPLAWLSALLTVWCVYFFRDPDRVTPVREGLVVSPADGVVQKIGLVCPPVELEMGTEERVRISIFMNVFNVHVNRIPATGRITTIAYTPGKFLNASLDKASENNERNALRLIMDTGEEIAIVQIAGLIARRIVCHAIPDQEVEAGERFGMIRFGSRLDVYLDRDMTALVVEGQQAVAGETVLADTASKEVQRDGAVR